MRIRRTAIGTGLIALALALSMVAVDPAMASSGPATPTDSPTGGSSSAPLVPTPQEAQKAKDKGALAAAWYAQKNGTGTLSDYNSKLAAYKQTWGTAAAAPSSKAPATAMTANAQTATAQATYHHLDGYYQVGENPYYYCGPASGYSTLNYLGYSVSEDPKGNYNGTQLSQSSLAVSEYMNTDAQKSTNWGSNDWARGVNNWMGGTNGSGYYVEVANPGSNFGAVVVYDIDNYYPFGADTYEPNNITHYNHHPYLSNPIRHWLGVYGYDNSGYTADFADSSASLWGSSYGVARYFNWTSQSFATTYLADHGIVY